MLAAQTLFRDVCVGAKEDFVLLIFEICTFGNRFHCWQCKSLAPELAFTLTWQRVDLPAVCRSAVRISRKMNKVVENSQDRQAIFLVVSEQSLLQAAPLSLPICTAIRCCQFQIESAPAIETPERSDLLEAVAVNGEEDVGAYGCMDIE